MKLLFVHDHPFTKIDDLIYSGGSFPFYLWDNYLIYFNTVTVFARNSNSKSSGKVKSSYPNVDFQLTNNYSSIKAFFLNYKKLYQELSILMDDADVVLVRLPSILGFLASHVAHKKNKKVWVEQVGNAQEALSSHGSLIGKVASPMLDYLNKSAVAKADFASYVTQNKLQKDYPAKPDSITLSASNVIIKNILGDTELQKDRYFKGKFKIGLVGGFDAKYKGQDILLEAVNLLPDDIKQDIELNFAGKGDYKWILSLAKSLNLRDNISFIGSLQAGDEINEFLQQLSLYTQPSLTEGMPRATIEAMSMGCPVIGSNVGGIPDIVSDNFVHKKGNTEQLSQHIKELYQNRELLYKEAKMSLVKADPYLKFKLDIKRKEFYQQMDKFLAKN